MTCSKKVLLSIVHIFLQEAALAKITSALSEAEAQAKGKAAHSAKVILSLEREVGELRGQLKGEQEEREREMREAREKAEEEKQSYVRIQEAAVSQFMIILGVFRFNCRLSVGVHVWIYM